jgi:hypothetical protein
LPGSISIDLMSLSASATLILDGKTANKPEGPWRTPPWQ